MKKEEVSLNSRVFVPGMGAGTVVGLMPESRFYVKVDFESGRYSGQEVNASVENMRPVAPPKPTREEKSRAMFETIRRTPASYYIAGLAAAGPSNIHVSTPPKHMERTKEELAQHGVEFETGLSESTERSMGRSISVIMPNHGIADEYERETGVRSTPYQGHSGTVSIQAKQFVLDFLLDFLKFRLGTRQDVEAIRQRVPEQYRPEFENGVEASLAESLMQ